MKPILVGILAAAFLFPVAAISNEVEGRTFIQTGSWWNLYFANDNNPLERSSGTIHAVKIVAVDDLRPSWVRIAFPESREDHFSMFGAVSRAHDNDDVSIANALGEWEAGISEWKTIWVNLHYVVSISKVEQGEGGNSEHPGADEPSR